MADITSYQNLFYGQIETPTAPNPRLASAISENDTDLIFTNSIKDEDGNVPDKALIIGIKEAISGYIESVYIPKYIMSGDITSGSVAVINIADTSKLAVGMRVIGTGIQANTTILAIDSSTQITLNQSATATATESLTFLSLSGDGLKAYGVVRGIARSGVNGIDFDTSVSANRVAHTEGDQVRVNISALLFEMINQVTSGQISNGQSTFRVGDGTDVDVYFYINNGDANLPFFKYDAINNAWYYSDDGVTESPMGGSGSLTAGNGIDITAGTISVDNDTTTLDFNGNQLRVKGSLLDTNSHLLNTVNGLRLDTETIRNNTIGFSPNIYMDPVTGLLYRNNTSVVGFFTSFSTVENIASPIDVAIFNNEVLVVLSGAGGNILRFNQNGTYKSTTSLAVSIGRICVNQTNGELLVTEASTTTVRRYNTSFSLLGTFTQGGVGAADMKYDSTKSEILILRNGTVQRINSTTYANISSFVVPASTYGFCEKSGYIYAVSTSTLYKYETTGYTLSSSVARNTTGSGTTCRIAEIDNILYATLGAGSANSFMELYDTSLTYIKNITTETDGNGISVYSSDIFTTHLVKNKLIKTSIIKAL